MEPIVNGLARIAVRTPTLPPATHTNTWIAGEGSWTVVDPASPYEDEQGRLFEALAAGLSEGGVVERILLTHHHLDHVSGAADLQRRLRGIGHDVPVAAHAATAALVAGLVDVDVLVEDGDRIGEMTAFFTPGHAPGHLALQHTDGWVIAGDLVAGIGTIAIDPREGDLQDYLDSLARIRGLRPTALMPAHGPVLPHADEVLAMYIAHRHARSEQIVRALDRLGRAEPIDIAPVVYPELDVAWHGLAAAQILTHLHWLERNGAVERAGERSFVRVQFA